MDSILRDKWIQALTNGSYKQGRMALCKSDESRKLYCCLGVLCDIVGVPCRTQLDSHGLVYDFSEYGVRNPMTGDVPTPEFLNVVGITSMTAKILTRMNDSGYSFKYIADYIKCYI